MANGFSKQIRERIGAAVDGTIFVNSDFADIADQETVRTRLRSEKIFENIYASPRFCGRGIFSEKPDFGKQWKNTVPGSAKIYPHFVGFLAWKSGERKELRQKKNCVSKKNVIH